MNRKKYIVVLALAIVLAIGLCSVPRVLMRASANSAPHFWEGAFGIGVLGQDDCPLTVECETLTFTINSLPTDGGAVPDGYDAHVTAAYTFYNPTESDITATLDFPFGFVPDYLDGADVIHDTARYDVTVDGVAVQKTLRYTPYMYSFDTQYDVGLLYDTYLTHDFLAPELPVTEYVFTFDESATAAFIAGDTGLYLLPERTNELSVKSGMTVTVYGIGEGAEQPHWSVEADCDSVPMTFEDFLLRGYEDTDPVSRIDLYNALLTNGNRFYFHDGRIGTYRETPYDELMRWYEYTMTVPANARVENVVTAPLYPGGNFGYTPTTFQYTYLLSPAKSWAAFGDLNIVVETPYYCLESALGYKDFDFEATDGGYALYLDGLPEGELTFTLCTSPNPKVVHDYAKEFAYILLFVFALPFWLYARIAGFFVDNPLSIFGVGAILLVVVLVFALIMAVVQSRQKKNAKHYVLRKPDNEQTHVSENKKQ